VLCFCWLDDRNNMEVLFRHRRRKKIDMKLANLGSQKTNINGGVGMQVFNVKSQESLKS